MMVGPDNVDKSYLAKEMGDAAASAGRTFRFIDFDDSCYLRVMRQAGAYNSLAPDLPAALAWACIGLGLHWSLPGIWPACTSS
jgi:hypothetical protein